MSNHTPGLVALNKDGVTIRSAHPELDEVICNTAGTPVHPAFFSDEPGRVEDNARRIVAAWNATADMSDPVKEVAALRAHATACEKALRRAVPWLGRMIADGGHLNAVAPNDAVGALAQAEAAIGLRLNRDTIKQTS